MSFPATRSINVSPKLRFGAFEVDFTNKELRKHGLRIKLQRKPFRILELLLQTPGQLVMRELLAEQLWPGLHVSFDRSLNTAVNALRRALGDTSRTPRYIETRTGLGYRFIASVEEVGGAEAPRPAGIQLVAVSGAVAEARQDCLKGRYFCHKLNEDDLHKAIAHFHAALARDPQCAFAYAGLADAYCFFALLNMAPAAEVYPRAKEMALKAIHTQQDLAEAHAALAGVKRIFEWDWAGAEAEYLTALLLGSGSALIHLAYGTHLATLGRAEEALREFRRAEELDALSTMVNVSIAWGLYVARDFQGASEQAWKVLAMEPKFAPAQYVLGLSYAQMGMSEEAIVELRNARTCAGDQPAILAALGYVYGSTGDMESARTCGSELEEMAQRRCVSPYWRSLVQAGLGEPEPALALLEQACQERDAWLTWLKVEPRFDNLRQWTRFQDLSRKVLASVPS